MNSNLPVPPKETIADPTPVLAGYSYAGAMITVERVADTVIGLVYDSGYAIEEAEILGQLTRSRRRRIRPPVLECKSQGPKASR
ncbi:hypothetical protein [Nocardia sp. NPDC004123]